jgi:diguanylate cyclase (GGDEF)-like protein
MFDACRPKLSGLPYGNVMLSDTGIPNAALLVLFAGALGIATGLRFGLRNNVQAALWAGTHALAALGGMALSLDGGHHWPWLAVCAHTLCIGAQVGVHRGVARQTGAGASGVEPRKVRHIASALVLLLVIGTVLGMDAHAVTIVGHAAAAGIVCLTMDDLLHDRRHPAGMGRPLALAACVLQVGAQAMFVYGALGSWPAEPGLPLPAADESALVAQTPLLLMLMAIFAAIVGFTLMAIEVRVAQQLAQARLDPLTGLLNRGALETASLSLADDHVRHGRPLSCLVVDIDRFKLINDNAGHRAGDRIIKLVAEALRGAGRATDVVGRYGGEEFCMVCPHTTEEEALVLAERLRQRVRAIALPSELGGFASVSIGIAQANERTDARQCWESLFGRADRALYAAKRGGRDRIVVAGGTPASSGGAGRGTGEHHAAPVPTPPLARLNG